jgi:hypothetical protein
MVGGFADELLELPIGEDGRNAVARNDLSKRKSRAASTRR